MKFNRRFVGIATACALATSALVAPAAGAAETTPETKQSSISTGSELSSKLGSSLDAGAQLSSGDTGKSAGDTDSDEKDSADVESGSSDKFAALFRDEDGKVDPSKITAWIGVITAVVGALATLASHLDIPGLMNK